MRFWTVKDGVVRWEDHVFPLVAVKADELLGFRVVHGLRDRKERYGITILLKSSEALIFRGFEQKADCDEAAEELCRIIGHKRGGRK